MLIPPPAKGIIGFDARYVNDRYHGIGRHAFHTLEALTRLDSERRYVVYFCPALENTRFDWRALAGRPNLELRPIDLPLYSPREQILWPAQLAADKVSLFHSPYVALPILPVPPLLAQVPMVMTIHDCILERYPEYVSSAALRRIYAAQTQLAVRRAAAICTVSEATRRDAERYYPETAGKLTVIGGAVDNRFQPVRDADHLQAVRERYRLPERFLLTVGAGRPHKNVGIVVEAMAHLDRAYAPALVVAGEPDERFADEVTERARVRGLERRIVRTGFVRDEDLPALYSLADVFVFPSLVEGFGLPPLEAMACGTPVVASNASSIPEVVADAALLFDPEDVSQLARHLLRVLSDSRLRADLAVRGRARAATLTWDRVAKAALAVYAALVEAPAREARDHSADQAADALPTAALIADRSASPAQRPKYAAA